MFAYPLFTSAALRKPHCLGMILPRTSRILAGDTARFVLGWAAQVGVDAHLPELGGTQSAPGQLYAKGASPKG